MKAQDDDSSLVSRISQSTFAHNHNFQVVYNDDNNIRQALASLWTKATLSLFLSTAVCDEWWERLWKLQANDPSRHYHTVVHLHEMLGYYQLVSKRFDNISPEEDQAIILAIFFHDAIYDALSSENEENSIKLFQSFVESSGQDSTETTRVRIVADLVVEYIAATKKHAVSSANSTALALFLDLDMAVLGKESAAYHSYAQLIRKEYHFVLHDTYCEKRADILASFLSHQTDSSIYGTVPFRQALEERARDNLAGEIQSLRKGIIPGES
jgi:predicted metal-dependent HD superfamily phosphohydrolase